MKHDYAILPLSARLLVLHLLFSGRRLSPIIDRLDDEQIVAFQRYVWDKSIEFGIRTKGKDFSSKDITRRMISSADYQREQECKEPLYACKASSCISSNRECARRKISGQVDVMAQVIWEYVVEGKQRERETAGGPPKRPSRVG